MASPRHSLQKVAPASASAADVPLMESQRPHSNSPVTVAADDSDAVAPDLEALEKPPLTLHPSFYIL